MNEEKLKEKLLDWDQTLKSDARTYNAQGNNRMYYFALGCLSIVHEVLKEIMEEDHERRN